MESGEIGAEIRGLIKSLHTEQIFFNPQPFWPSLLWKCPRAVKHSNLLITTVFQGSCADYLGKW
jgi:hypothetical protein